MNAIHFKMTITVMGVNVRPGEIRI